MFTQTSKIGGAEQGAGALRYGKAADQTGNLLEMMNTSVMTPEKKVLHPAVGGVKKKRFGATGVNHMFDYPELAVKNPSGNGQSYKAQKGHYLPGNNGGGQAGYGVNDPHAYGFKEEADLTFAKEVAFREAQVMPHFVKPEHTMYHDKTHEELKERLVDMAEDYRRDYIRNLKAKGFTDEEIERKLEKDREKAIESAEKMPMDKYKLMEAQLAQMLPVQEREDYPNQSVPPGAIARRQDATAYERALNVGNPVANARKMAAKRQEARIRGELPMVEPYKMAREQETIHTMISRISHEMGHKTSEKTAEMMIKAQKKKEGEMREGNVAIHKALLK